MKPTNNLINRVAAFFILAVVAVTVIAASATVTMAQGQSGYWAKVVARDATIRDGNNRPIRTLTNGMWFHVYPSYKSQSFFLGYACPNGNRGCSNRQSTPGYILKSVLSGRVAMNSTALPVDADMAFSVPVMTTNQSLLGSAFYSPALYSITMAVSPAAIFPASPGVTRRICAREVWMRDDRLWPIELLRAGDVFVVERYTDGSKNDGNARWAIGRAKNLRGRVLVTALCR